VGFRLSAHDSAERARVAVALTLVQIFFGLHYLAAKGVLEHVPTRAWAATRVVAAAGVLFAAAWVTKARIPRSRADLPKLALYALFGVAVNQVCFVEGLARTTPIHSSLVNTTIPVGTLLFATLARHERFTLLKIVSLAVSFAGVLLVLRPDAAALRGGQLLGDVLTLINALSYSFFLVISRKYLARTDPLGATAMMLGLGAIPILLFSIPDWRGFDPAAVPALTWGLAAFIVIFPTAGAYLLASWALARVESSMVALFIYLQPVVAVTLSAALGTGRPSTLDLVGGALIFLGVFLTVNRGRAASRARLREARHSRPGRTPESGAGL
jgi:drug/metabolite transporter (DMT)-like permease